MEEWRDAVGYRNYQVSNLGRVRNSTTGEVLTHRVFTRRHRTPRVVIRKDGSAVTVHVGRLVAAAFIGPLVEGTFLRYRDHNADNVCLENLYYSDEQHPNYTGKKVRIIEYGHVFNSVSEAAESLEVTRTAIRYAAQGRKRTVSGLHLEFVMEEETVDA